MKVKNGGIGFRISWKGEGLIGQSYGLCLCARLMIFFCGIEVLYIEEETQGRMATKSTKLKSNWLRFPRFGRSDLCALLWP